MELAIWTIEMQVPARNHQEIDRAAERHRPIEMDGVGDGDKIARSKNKGSDGAKRNACVHAALAIC